MIRKLLAKIDQKLLSKHVENSDEPSTADAINDRIDVLQLEDRILYSAVPFEDPTEDANSFVDANELVITTSATAPTALLSAETRADNTSDESNSAAEDSFALRNESDPTHWDGNALTASFTISREIVFLDVSVDDFDQLLNDVLSINDPQREIEVVLLSSERDGVEQISEALKRSDGLDAIHIVSHGSEGSVQLGNAALDRDSLHGYAGQVASWASALNSDADILFYGCDFASGEGTELVDSLSALTGADVAASDDFTGHEELGGDWILEYQVGDVSTDIAFSFATQASWYDTLANITVTTTADENDGDTSSIAALQATSGGLGISLREAIIAANNTAGADTIILGTNTYLLNVPGQYEGAAGSGDLDITSDITITGDGAASTIIDASALGDRIFEVHAAGGLTLDGMTLTGASSGTESGAAVRNLGTLNATDVVFSGNSTTNVSGGAIHSSGTATLDRVAMINNTTTIGGGGLYVDGGTTSLTNSTVSGNTTVFLGGGILVENAGTVLNITHSTIANNTATDVNSFGGGLYVTDATVNVDYSIFADNTSSQGGNDVNGAIVSGGYNIIEHNSGFSGIVGSDILGSDPGLSALTAVDGTYVHTFGSGSIAYNAATGSGETLDQAGTSRDANPDIGAYEVQDVASDIQSVSTTNGGVSLNHDGGNDAYFHAEDTAFWTGDRLTMEFQISDLQNTGTASTLFSTTDAMGTAELRILSDGRLSFFGIDSSVASLELFDGEDHSVTFTWNGSSGALRYYVDGAFIEQVAGPVGSLISTNFVLGQDQDALGGPYDPSETFSGTYRDVRIFSAVRTDTQIQSTYRSTLPHDEADMSVNWRFDHVTSDGTVIDAVAGRNLTAKNIGVGGGFTSSNPEMVFTVNENSTTGTVVGSLEGIDAERQGLINSLLAADPDLVYSAETGKFYKHIDVTTDWSTALATATGSSLNGISGQLVTIRSAFENQLIWDMAITATDNIWLGASDQNVEGDYYWYEGSSEADLFWIGDDTGFAVDGAYTNWNPSDPNNLASHHYGFLTDSDGTWWDNSDTSWANTVVEWNANEVLDASQSLTYSIVSQSVAGSFAIDADNGQIIVSDGSLLDYETNATHTITVRSTDVDSNTYDEMFTISINDLAEANNAPTDLSSGIELNSDGGNDAYLHASTDLIASLDSVTLETSFAIDHTPGQNHTLVDFYSTSGIDDELLLRILSDGSIRIGVGDINLTSTESYASVLDGGMHHLALSWESTNGDWTIFVDGEFAESGTGLHSGSTLSAGTSLSIGQSFDDAGDSNVIDAFSGTLYDVRVWNKVRSEAEVSLNYQHKFDIGSLPSGLIANWQMDGFNGSNQVVDVVSGNNLSIGHATGAGFIVSTPVDDLHIDENASDGTTVGFVVPTDPDALQDIVSDGLFAGASPPSGGQASFAASSSFGDWTVGDATGVTVFNGDNAQTPPSGGHVVTLNNAFASISQTLTTEIGKQYQIVFDHAGGFGDGLVDHVTTRVSAAGQSEDFTLEKPPGWNFNSNLGWETRSLTFTADDTSTELIFQTTNETLQDSGLIAGIRVIEIPAAVTTILNNDSTLSYDAATGKFYRFVSAAEQFSAAVSSANSAEVNGVSGQLLTVRSEYENESARQLAAGNDVWIGATDATVEGEWRWLDGVSDGEQFWTGGVGGSATSGSYVNWYSGSEPNNATGVTLDGEDAAVLHSGGGWYDQADDPSQQLGYIIEWDASEVLSNFTFSLTDDAGGRFAIDSNTGEITVANGFLLDYETDTSHTIDVQTTDSAGNSFTETMTIAVDDQADGAILTVPIAQTTDEDVAVTFSSGGGNAIVVDTGTSNDVTINVTLSVASGTLTLSQTTGLSFLEGTSNGESTLVIAGKEPDINAALEGMQYLGNPEYSGADTLTITTGSTAATESNIYASYEFTGGSVADDSGNGYDGASVGDPTVSMDAERGDVMTFDGDDRIAVTNGTLSLGEEVTIAAWVNLDAGQTNQVFLSIGDTFYVTLDPTTTSYGMGISANGFTTNNLNSSNRIAGEGWHHVAATVNDTTNELNLYLDGVLIKNRVYDFGDIDWATEPSQNITIGAMSDGSDAFVGSMDDVRIYDSELSESQIVAIMGDQGYASENVGITINSVNDAPVMDNSGFLALDTISENETAPVGNTVAEILASDGGDPISDVDAGALEGIALTSVAGTYGTWQYDTGSGWTDVGSVSDSSALLLRTTDSLRYLPDGSNGETPLILFKAWDQTSGAFGTKVDTSIDGGSTAFSSGVEAATIEVTSVNDAPVMSPYGPVYNTTEDSAPFSATVAAMLSSSISDVDSSAVEGIAVYNSTGSVGTLEYSTDGGTNWFTFGALSPTSATLLRATDLFRYTPDGISGGTMTLDYYAWDQTSGTAGTSVDVTTRGGTTAFSTVNDTVTINVTDINDGPSGTDNTLTINEDSTHTFTAAEFGYSDVDGNSLDRVWIMTLPGAGQLKYNGSTFAANNWVSKADIDLGLLTYEPAADANGTSYASFDFQVQDDGGTSNGGVNRDTTSNTITFDVTAQNDDPVVDHGGAYVIDEGDSLSLDASATTDIDGDTLTYRWDLNNDAIYDITTTTATTTPTWSALTSYGIDDDGVYTIGLQVDDGNGGVVTTSTTVTVNNIAPDLSATGSASAVGGSTYTLTLTDVDPGDDAITQWIVNWGDGSIDTYAGDPASVTHVYSNDLAGLTFDITVSAVDEDGQYFEANVLVPAYGGDYVNEYDGAGGTFIGSFAPSSDGIAGHANIVLMPTGNYLVSGIDSGNILEYQPDGSLVGDFVAAGDPNLSNPGGIAFGPDGHLYVADYGAGKVVRFDGASGAYIDDFVASGLSNPLGLEFGPDGDLYVANRGSAGVLRYDGTTGTLDAGFNVANISGAEDLTFGPDGNLYVGSTNGVIRVDATTGATSTFISNGTGGLGLAAGVDFGPDGNLYVADQNNNVVRIYDGSTGAYLSDYATGVGGPAYLDFTPDHRVTVTNSNQSPTIATNTGITVDEGSIGNAITTAMLNEGDPDDDGAELTYTITGDVTNGILQLSGVTIGLNDTFTQADIDAGFLTYSHSGNETIADSFGFSLADGGEGGATPATGTFNLTITPIDDAPILGNNALNVVEGGQVVLTTANMSATDVDSNDPDLTFTVSNLDGISFRLVSSNVGVTSFTQAQIAAGEIFAAHDGSNDAPSYQLSVSDGTTSTVPAAAAITFTAVNDQPYLDANGQFDESLVNTTTAGEQIQPRITVLASGNYVIVWNDGSDVQAQIFQPDRTPLGGELLLDDTAVVGETSVASTQSGGFAIAWVDGSDVRVRAFDATGNPTGSSLVVASGTSTIVPEITQLAGGKFAVVYQAGSDVHVQMLTSGLALDGGAILVPDVTTGTQTLGNVVALQSGGFAVAFSDAAGRDGESHGAYLQRFDSSGSPIGGNILVNQNTSGAQRIDDMAELAGGEIVVTFRDNAADGSSSGVVMRVLDASGTPVTGDLIVSQTTTGHQDDGNIAILADGTFAVVWQSAGANGEKDAFIRRFAADGTALSDEMLLNTDVTHWNRNAQATLLPGDRLAVTWAQSDLSGLNHEIVQRHFDFSGHSIQFVENDAATVVHDHISIVDFDDSHLESATVSVSSNYVNGEDVLNFVNQNGITGNWDAASGTLTLTGTATLSEYETALRSVTYSNASDSPSSLNRTVSWTVNDGDVDSFTRTSTIEVLAVNDDPTIGNLNGETLNYTEGDGAVVIDQGVSVQVADVDSSDFNGGVLTVGFSAGSDATEDILAIRNQGNGPSQVGISGSDVTYSGTVVGTFSGGSGGADLLVVFNASATADAVAAVTRNVTYENTDTAAPTTSSRTVEFVVTDGDGGTSLTQSTTVNVTGTNDAPALDDGAGLYWLTSITEDDTNNAGQSVASIIASNAGSGINDPDGVSVPEGIAIRSISASSGTWQYSIDGGSNWNNMGTVSTTSALVLRENDWVRFVPDGIDSEQGNLTFIAWDQTDGSAAGTKVNASTTGGSTAFSDEVAVARITVTAVNDAPVLDNTGSMSMTTITEDNITSAGNTIASIISSAGGNRITDVDPSAVEGIAITTVNSGNGYFEYSTNGGSNWSSVGSVSQSSALLLRANDLIRFIPNQSNATSASFEFQAWDQTSGTAGTKTDVSVNGGSTAFSTASETVDLTVTAINDAPHLTNGSTYNFAGTDENTTSSAINVHTLNGGTGWSDVDSGAVRGAAITGLSGLGTWQYSTDGTTWNSFGSVSASSALLLDAGTQIRYVPDGVSGETATFTFKSWDQTSGTASTNAIRNYGDATVNGGTTAFSTESANGQIVVSSANDAPVLDNTGTMTLTTISEDDTNNGGNTVASIIASAGGDRITDAEGNPEGIAITTRNNGNGQWQYSIDGGTNWSAVGSVSETSALLLRSTDLLRFAPDGENGITQSVTFRAWDQTSGTAGTKVDVSTNGGATAFSTDSETASIVVTSVNDAPTITDSSTFTIAATNEDANSASNTVSTILTSASHDDVDDSHLQGMAITGVVGNGTWQYSTDGSTWTAFGSVSASSALLLDANTQIRFAPDAQNGETATFTFRAWDQSTGTASTGGSTSYGDTTSSGGTTAYSSQSASAQITVSDVNDAPVFNTGGSTTLTTISEDDVNNAGNTIASIIATAGGDRITDVDNGAVEGVAIRTHSTSGGTWQYQLDGTGTWVDFGTVTPTSALLLRSNDLVRYVPDGENGETVWISLRAWDQTSGSPGDKVNSNTTGGTTSISDGTKYAYLTVTDANDAPTVTGPATATVDEGGSLTFDLLGAGVFDTDDVDGDNLTVTLTADRAAIALSQTTGLTLIDNDGSDGTLQFSGSTADIDAALFGLDYDSQAGYNGSAYLVVLVDDGSLSDSTTVAITVNPGQTVFVWDGGGATNDWTDADNWNHDLVPDADDIVVFDTTSTKDSTLDAAFAGTISEIQVNTGYTGTLTFDRTLHNSGDLTIADGTVDTNGQSVDMDGFINVTGGTLTFDGSTIMLADDFIHSGGTLNTNGSTLHFDGTGDRSLQTSAEIDNIEIDHVGTLTFLSDLSFAGDFTHSQGTVDFGGYEVSVAGTTAQAIDASGLTFDDFEFNNLNTVTIVGGLDVDGDLTYTNAVTINGAGVTAAGHVTTTDSVWSGTSVLTLDGTVDQNIATGGGAGELGNLVINKTSGTVRLLNDIELGGDFTYTAGGFDTNGNTVEFQGHNTVINAGSATFGDVILNSTIAGSRSIVGTLDVDGHFTFTNTGTLNGGQITVAGDITYSDDSYSGTTTIIADGTGNQTVTASNATAKAEHLTINKASGTLTFATDLTINGSLTHIAGAVTDLTTTITFGNNSGTINASAINFDDVVFDSNYSKNIAGVLNVGGDLTITRVNALNVGEIRVAGNVTSTDTTVGGDATLILVGTGDQTISGDDLADGKVTIDKTSGTLFLADDLVLNGTSQDIDFISGTLDLNGQTVNATGEFLVDDSLLIGAGVITNNLTLDNDAIIGLSAASTSVYESITVGGTLTLGLGSQLQLDVNGISAGGYLEDILTSSSLTGTFDSVTLVNDGVGFTAYDEYDSPTGAVDIFLNSNPSGSIGDVNVNEDAPDTVIDLDAAFSDLEHADNQLTYSLIGYSSPVFLDSATIDNGAGTLTLDYAANQSGTAQLTVRATDPRGGFTDVTFDVTVGDVNDAPVASDGTNSAVEDGTSVGGTLVATDADPGDALTYSLVSNTSEGTAVVNSDGTYTFDPGTDFQDLAAGESREVTFVYRVTDDGVGTLSDDATITITVTGTNDAPVAQAGTNAATEDGAVVSGTLLETDADTNDTHTFALVTGTSEGTAVVNSDGSYTFDPGADFQDLAQGEARDVTFVYEVSDNHGATSQETITITVTGTNDAPVAQAGTNAATEDGAVVSGTLLETDADTNDTHTFALVTGTSEGTAVVNSDGSYTFDPGVDFQDLAQGEARDVTFVYEVADNHGATSQETITITVTGTNDAPVAQAGTNAATEDGAIVSGTLLETDADTNDTHTFTLVTGTSEGTAVVNSDGSYTFNPGADFQDLAQGEARDVTFVYEVADNHGATSQETITITVTGTNDAPTLDNSGDPVLPTITEDDVTTMGTTVADLLATGAGGDPITDQDGTAEGIAITSRDNGNGQWQYSLDGGTNWSLMGPVSDASALLLRSTDLVRFLPDANDGGVYTFDFRAWDQTSGTAGASVDTTTNGGSTAFSTAIEAATISVTSVNDAPILDNSGALVLTTQVEDAGPPAGAVGTAISDLVSLGGNVTDVDSAAQTGIAITDVDATNGTWWYTIDGGTNWNTLGAPSESMARMLNASGLARVYFEPDADFNGTVTDAITFRAWDRTVGLNGSIQDVTTNGGTTAFSAATETADLTVTAVNDGPAFSSLDANPTFVEGGTAVVFDNDVSLFDRELSGVDDFGGSSLTLSRNGAPNALDVFGTSGNLAFNGNVLELSTVAIGSVSNVGGQLTLSFDPGVTNTQVNEVLRSLTYENASAAPASTVTIDWVFDDGNSGAQGSGGSLTAVGSITIDIDPRNDAPVLNNTFDLTLPDVGEDDSDPTGTTVANLLLSDAGSDPITDPDLGAVEGIAVTGIDNSNGTWQYSLDNGLSWGDIAAVSDSNALLLDAADMLRFVPDADYHGTTGNITFRAWDQSDSTASGSYADASTGGGQSAFSVSEETAVGIVNSINDDPFNSGSLPTDLSVVEDQLSVLDLSAIDIQDVDAGGDDLTITLVTSAGGRVMANMTPGVTVVGNNSTSVTLTGTLADLNDYFNTSGNILYLHPSANLTGNDVDSLTVSVTDHGSQGAGGGGYVILGVANIDIAAVNDAPQAVGESYAVDEDNALSGNVLDNDIDIDSDPLTAILVGSTSSGALVLNADGSFSYIPDADFHGTDSFTYEVTDGTATSGPVTADINIAPVNDAPVAVDDSFAVLPGGTLELNAATGIAANDLDIDGDNLTVVVVSAPARGTLTVLDNGSISYVPDPNFAGTVSFTYYLSDGVSQSAEATVSIFVNQGVVPTPNTGFEGEAPTTPDIVIPISQDVELSSDGKVVPTNSVSGIPFVFSTITGSVEALVERSETSEEDDEQLSDFAELLEDESFIYRNQAFAVASRQIEETTKLFSTSDLEMLLSQFATDDAIKKQQTEVISGTATGLFIGVTALGAMWLASGSSLVALLASSLPAWAQFDPIFIITNRTKQPSDDDDVTVAQIIQQQKSGGES